MTNRRSFIKKAAVALPAAGVITAAPAIAQSKIKWRMQTYAGTALAEHVIKPAIDKFNKIAGDEMEIELFFACLLYTSPSPRDRQKSRMPSSA